MKKVAYAALKFMFCMLALVFIQEIICTHHYGAMPFYDLHPQELMLRSAFYTSYGNSSKERKHNIYLAAQALDNTFIDVGGEFSFNDTVGPRTQARGYKKAKIIFNGAFIDGIGGGVCQVSSTLYNAALLSDLLITEYHSHSLPVSYVALSFDAMVNSGSADLRFINNTHNPVIIKTSADGSKLKISIYGEPPEYTIERKSVTVKTIAPPPEQILKDIKGEYPDLYKGEKKVVSYGKNGYKSEGYVIKKKDGCADVKLKIRTDTYAAVRGIIIEGTAVRPTGEETEPGESEDLGGEVTGAEP